MTNILNLQTKLPGIKASFAYLAADAIYETEKPYTFIGPLDISKERYRTNIRLNVKHDITVRDVRALDEDLSIDREGFQLIKQPTHAFIHRTQTHHLQEYLKEVVGLVKQELGAELAICYDYRFRKNAPPDSPIEQGTSGLIGSQAYPAQPNNIAHVDHTKNSGPRRALKQLSQEEADKYFNDNWRLRIVKYALQTPKTYPPTLSTLTAQSAWRPLFHPVKESPLAFCDSSTVDASDIVEVDRLAATAYLGEVCYLKYNPKHRWYWFSHQTPDEMTLFVNYDSAPRNERANICPHASFVHDGIMAGTPPRESIEARIIVVTSKSETATADL